MSKSFKRTFLPIVIAMVLCACTTTKQLKSPNNTLNPQIERNHFVGLLVVDPTTKDTLYNIHAEKYFTPASTTKIFTLYTALKLLPERIPTIKYISKNDTLFFEGTGDPTQLHPYFKDSTTVQFLSKYDKLAWHTNNYSGDLLGPGWAWEDYQYYYQVERGALPLYGNVAHIYHDKTLQVSPKLFEPNVMNLDHSSNREIEENAFYYTNTRRDTIEIPFRTDSTLTKKLLAGVLNRPITIKGTMPKGEKTTLWGIPSDSVYKRMMHESDNFLADQLLVLSSGILSDTLNGETARKYILENELSNLRQAPRWVDGSGLSRYNLFTPESMVAVLDKLRQELTQERLFNFFVPGGIPEHAPPYIYAKSGSVGNNYSLNGYVLTKSGKILIFSFMNNHYLIKSQDIRKQVQEFLKHLHETY